MSIIYIYIYINYVYVNIIYTYVYRNYVSKFEYYDNIFNILMYVNILIWLYYRKSNCKFYECTLNRQLHGHEKNIYLVGLIVGDYYLCPLSRVIVEKETTLR